MADNLIFISYSHKDSDFVKKAIAELESQNYNIWYDESLEGGSRYNDKIATKIRNCDCFIAFMSRNYTVSKYCKIEIEYALKQEKDIFIVYIDDVRESDLPPGIEMHISGLHAVFRRDFETDADFIAKICNEPIITKYKLCKTISELKGTEILNDNNEYSYTYTGETVDGKRHGKGKCTWDNGMIYDGEWIDDKRNGIGKLTATDGTYDGEWKDDQMDGKGKLCTDSYIYEGDWKDGRICGTGICTWKDGNGVYEGEWKDGKFHGIGRFKCPNGDVYEGEWKDGQKYGKGKYTWSNGAVYVGEWIDGKQHGRGIYTCSDGTVYEGEWKDDNLNGKVRITYSNGKQKIYSFRNGKKVLL